MRSPSGHSYRLPHSTVRPVAFGTIVLAGLLLAGCSAANAGSITGSPASAATPSASAAPIETMPLAKAPSTDPGIAASPPGQASAGGSAGTAAGVASGSAVASIAYPFAGNPGVAPDHTIVVVGTGSATAASEAARPTAQHDALLAALADARSQAEAIASATHVTIDGVLSVSASQSPYLVYPMGIEAPAGGGTTPGAAAPDIQPPTAIAPQGPTMVTASVTVAYSIH